jgi:TolB-like protein/class 3 adenylate cyclase
VSGTGTDRRLASIVALDVAGFSARVEADEAGTIAAIAQLRSTIERIAHEHSGRIFNTAGDGFMLEFGSSSAAMEAAFALAETCEPKVRVGVHLGEVAVQPTGDLLGHGVNVAARLMAQAGPGSALVSSAVRQTLRGPLAARLVSRGLLQLDKMNETIEGFVIVAGPDGSKAVDVAAKKEPLLAVLPFDNLSADQEMQFFSDGVSEEILQRLARSRLHVIARTSSFQFRGPDKSVAKVANQLRATHILDGSIRRAASRVRVAAQLVDAETQTALWSERFDRTLEDIFAVQEEIAESIAGALDKAFDKHTPAASVPPEVYDLYLRSRQVRFAINAPKAVALLEEATRRAPDFAAAWGRLAIFRTSAATYIPYAQRPAVAVRVDAEAARALALDPDNVDALLARIYVRPPFPDFSHVEPLLARLRRFGPSHAGAVGDLLAKVGRLREAQASAQAAYELDPLNPLVANAYGWFTYCLGRYAEARTIFEEMLRRWPDWYMAAICLSSIGALTGDWALVDAMTDPERLKQHPWLEWDEYRHTYLAILRDPSPQSRRRPLEIAEHALAATGHLSFHWLPLAARLGFVDEAYALAARAKFGPSGSPDDEMGPIAYTTVRLFFAEFSAFRCDPRFVLLCARLGLVEYWMTSGHWPDCVDEAAPHYDFKAECARVAGGPPLPPAT